MKVTTAEFSLRAAVEPPQTQQALVVDEQPLPLEGLDAVAELVRRDARCDPAGYVLRSNTNHNGE